MGVALPNGYQRLVTTLRRRAPAIARSPDTIDLRSPAVRIIDCILSLNRDYDTFVVPRLNAFEENYPNVKSVLQLQDAIGKHQTPADFVRQTLKYNHTARANTLSAVVNWMSILAGNHLPPKQLNNIQEWAQSASCKDYKKLAINGFGLAGFQYMRILFGADTFKPDRYICKFVEDYVRNKVSPQKALCLFEQAALDSGSVEDRPIITFGKSSRGENC